MANTEFVPIGDETLCSSSHENTTEQIGIDPETQNRECTPTLSEIDTSGMPCVREMCQGQNLSTRTIHVIMNSWRKSTQKQYSTYIYKWIKYARDKRYNILNPKLNEALNFMTYLFDLGLNYSTLNTARSALSNVITLTDFPTILFGQHPLVIRIMRGVFTLRPNFPRYTEIWNVADVLNYIDDMGNCNDDLSLMNLSFKLCTILALVSGQRVQSLHLLDINLMHRHKDKIVFEIKEPLKQSRPKYHLNHVEFIAFPHNQNLCVVNTLNSYIKKTCNLRKNHTKLLISYKKPHCPVSKDTISRWIKMLLGKSGINIDIYTAHSTRSASTSAARESGLSLNIIMSKVGWSSSTTFSQFYNKPIIDDNSHVYANSVLNSKKRKSTNVNKCKKASCLYFLF